MKCSSRRKSAQIYSRAASRPLLRKSRRQFFAVRQMVAIPAHQGGVAGVFKKKLQRRRFDVAVAKDHVGFALVAGKGVSIVFIFYVRPTSPLDDGVSIKTITYCHHIAWSDYFRLGNGRRKRSVNGSGASAKTSSFVFPRRIQAQIIIAVRKPYSHCIGCRLVIIPTSGRTIPNAICKKRCFRFWDAQFFIT